MAKIQLAYHSVVMTTYGVKTMNQQRMESEPARLDRVALTGAVLSSVASFAATVPWLASQKRMVCATM